jgi:predicted small lipoprotein YifL
MSSLLRATLMVLALLSTVACTSKPLYTPSRVIPASIHADQEQVKQSILKNLVARKWTVQRISPNLIQAEITVRETFHVEIDIDYSATDYKIVYRDSRGMDYKDGKIHKNYIRWVRLLDKGILRDLRDKQNERTAQQLSDAAQASPAPN